MSMGISKIKKLSNDQAGHDVMKYTNRQTLENLKTHAVVPQAGSEYMLYVAEDSKDRLRVRAPKLVVITRKTKNFAEWLEPSGMKGRCYLHAKDKLYLFLEKGGSKPWASK